MTDKQRMQIVTMRENGIGYKKIGQMLENPGRFTLLCGSKQLIIRHKFEEFLDETTEI